MLNLLIEPTTGEITFGEFMAMSDTNNRWVYKGFLTTPSCSKTIFFNILNKIL
jgi:carbonic anhydrase